MPGFCQPTGRLTHYRIFDASTMLKPLNQVNIQEDAPKCFLCAKNAASRIPFFLDYYRRLGVGTFFIVDNDSTDTSRDILLEQPDVVLYWTDESYQESNAGRRWTDELLDRYGAESWCLTLDIDEFLVFPFAESVDLATFCRYLDSRHFDGLFCVMLDFYPCGNLEDAEYKSGDSVFDVAACHDHVRGYRVHSDTYFPYLNVRGGVRQRAFYASWGKLAGPPQKKIPLVRNHEGFSYQYSTHGVTPLRLADVTAVLAHFKFFADSAHYIAAELKGRDRKNPSDYVRYLKGVRECASLFADEVSRQYEGSMSLVDEGFIAVSDAYLDFLAENQPKQAEADAEWRRGLSALHKARRRNVAQLKDLIRVWPIVAALQATPGSRVADDVDHLYQEALKYIDGSRKHYSLAVTLPLRRFLRKRKLINAKSMPESMGADYTLKEKIKFTYDSVWWDLAAPVRLVGRLYDSIRWRLRR